MECIPIIFDVITWSNFILETFNIYLILVTILSSQDFIKLYADKIIPNSMSKRNSQCFRVNLRKWKCWFVIFTLYWILGTFITYFLYIVILIKINVICSQCCVLFLPLHEKRVDLGTMVRYKGIVRRNSILKCNLIFVFPSYIYRHFAGWIVVCRD